MKAVAQQYIDQGRKVIPLSRKGDGKAPGHTRNQAIGLKNWETTEFKASAFFEDDNIGFNVGTSEIIEDDNDSENAVYFAPRFLNSTRSLGVKNSKGRIKVTHNLYKGKADYIKRCYSDKTTIAELRSSGNLVVPPSVAESKLFNKEPCERVWINNSEIATAPHDLVKQFNKKCVASVLKTVIESDNMPFVKLTACLKRYCQDWSEDEIYDFIEIVCDSIKHKNGGNLFSWKVVKAKVKTVLKNWDNEKTNQSGYDSFAKEVGLTLEYARDMFTWIGEVPKEGSKNDRKTIIDFVAMGMSAESFLKEVVREYLVAPLIAMIGLYIVAGRPKQGKSYLLRHLAYAVQNGLMWLGSVVKQGDALLLALEDNEDSMNLNVKDMNLQHKKKPTTFVDQCPSLERGFVESIRLWHKQMPNPKLVVIDTFQKIKPIASQRTRNANAYEVDYYYLSQLHDLAKELKLCIIYVHHLSQADKSHSWDKIMGSTGHQGVTDAMYMLEREEGSYKATFKGIGRNIPGFEMDIEWNTNPKEPFTFQYTGDTYQKKTQEHKRAIYLAMKQLAKDDKINVKPADVYKVLNLVNNKEKGACQKNMLRMKNKGELRDGGAFGEYCLAVDVSRIDDHGNIKTDDVF